MVHGVGGGGGTGGIGGTGGPGEVKPTAVETTPTGHTTADGVGGSTVAGGLSHTAPTATPGSVIKDLAAKETGSVKTVETKATPTKITSVSITYKTGSYDGRKLKPGEQMLLEIPPQFRDRPIRFAVLKHRQDSSETSSPPPGDKWDPKPGTTSMQVHSKDTGAWHFWKAPWGSSGDNGGKYAEHRGAGDPEVENMFDWMSQGHQKVGGGYGGTSKAPMHADAIKVVSVGQDPVRVHQIDVIFQPPKPDSMDEVIFSSGTKFGDPQTGQGRSYGGGPKFQGKYPGALALGYGGGGDGVKTIKDKAGWNYSGGNLEVGLTPGKKFTGVEVACGDTHPDGKANKDGHTGTLGYARLSMGVKHASGSTDWFVSDTGVPPEGVLFGGPTLENYVAQPGDKLVLRSSSDTTYLMGVRLWYND